MARALMRRAVIGLMCVLAGLCVLPAVTAQAAVPASFAAAAPKDQHPMAPKQLKVVPVDGDVTRVQVSWTKPKKWEVVRVSIVLTSYRLYLDGKQVAEFKLHEGKLPTSYVMDATPLRVGGDLTVGAVYNDHIVGDQSYPVTLPPQASGAITPKSAVDHQVDTYDENGFASAVAVPPYHDKGNQPTPEEVYGTGGGILTIYTESYSINHPGSILQNLFAASLWLFAAMLFLAGSAMLGWSLIKSTYAGLAAAMLAVIQSFGTSDMKSILVLAVFVLTGAWAVVMLIRDSRLVNKGIGVAILMGMGAMFYFANAATLIPKIVDAPLTSVQAVMGTVNAWNIPGMSQADYNLSVKPTYDGNILEQSVRKYINDSWLETTYPSYCQLNFGDLKWATTTRVPVKYDLKGYQGMTFCEYLLKAQTQNNKKALGNLISSDSLKGLGGHNVGAVEEASPTAWKFLQGTDPTDASKRAMYAVPVIGNSALDASIKGGLSLLTALTVVLIAWDAVLLAGFLIFSQLPPLFDYFSEHLKRMARRTWIPALAMGLFMVIDKVSLVMFSVTGPRGWLVEMSLRGVFVIGILSYSLVRFLKYNKHRRQQKPGIGTWGPSYPIPRERSASTRTAADAGTPASEPMYLTATTVPRQRTNARAITQAPAPRSSRQGPLSGVVVTPRAAGSVGNQRPSQVYEGTVVRKPIAAAPSPTPRARTTATLTSSPAARQLTARPAPVKSSRPAPPALPPARRPQLPAARRALPPAPTRKS